MIVVIDNYDSFVHNLARYFRVLGGTTHVVRNDQISIAALRELQPSHIVLSPGPCTPNEAGICIEVVKQFAGQVPILGVCLGHQAIGQAFGATVCKALYPMHGKSSLINHNSSGIFEGLPSPLKIGRYHSLVVDAPTPCLTVTAHTNDDTIMAIEHKTLPVWGVQFHPESVLTDHGFKMVENFMVNCDTMVSAR